MGVTGVELRQLRYFVTLAEELHFGRAAAREHIVQSALSQQVERLERELGVPLLERTTHHVRLTAAGTAFLLEARQILAHVDRAAAAAQRAARSAPALRVGTVDASYDSMPMILRRVQARFPDLEIHQVEAGVPEQWSPRLLREQQRLLGQRRNPDARRGGEPVTLADQHAQRVEPEQLGGHLGRGQRRPPDPDVQPPAGQQPPDLFTGMGNFLGSDRGSGWPAGDAAPAVAEVQHRRWSSPARRPCTNPGYAESVDENAWRSEAESPADRAFPLHHQEPGSAWRELGQRAATREKSPITSDSEK
jgi:DNA-binding transcriptional LysR family regulator